MCYELYYYIKSFEVVYFKLSRIRECALISSLTMTNNLYTSPRIDSGHAKKSEAKFIILVVGFDECKKDDKPRRL